MLAAGGGYGGVAFGWVLVELHVDVKVLPVWWGPGDGFVGAAVDFDRLSEGDQGYKAQGQIACQVRVEGGGG